MFVRHCDSISFIGLNYDSNHILDNIFVYDYHYTIFITVFLSGIVLAEYISKFYAHLNHYFFLRNYILLKVTI